MSANSTIDSACESKLSDSKCKQRLYKQILVIQLMNLKIKGPKTAQKQIAKQMELSHSITNKDRKDINLNSLYNTNPSNKKEHP